MARLNITEEVKIMKFEVKDVNQPPIFVPFTIHLTVEDHNELKYLWNIFNNATQTVEDAAPIHVKFSSNELPHLTLCEFWKQLNERVERLS